MIGLGIRVGLSRLAGAIAAAWTPAELFASSEVGVWYDPSDLTTLFQDSAGTTPVTATGQPVGLILDKSQGLVLGAELVTNLGTVHANDVEWSFTGGEWVLTAAADNSAILAISGAGVNELTVGKWYEVTWTVSALSSGSLSVRHPNTSTAVQVITTTGTYTARFLAMNAGLWIRNSIAGQSAAVSVFSVKELPGNHASQATAASRPIYRDVGGYQYLEFDGVDDCLFTTAIDFSATDKLSLFTGLKKLSDIDYSMVCELQVGGVGTFSIMAPSNVGDGYASWLGSTGPRQTSVNYLQPSLNTLAITHDTAGATTADETVFRINGGVVASSGIAIATTNFVNQPLYIGRRTNSTLPFTGYIYSLIVRGTMSDAGEIDDAETWVNGKTGAY